MIKLEKIEFSGKNPGKHLLVTGCMHGNEVCGYHGIKEIEKRVAEGLITFESGTVTFLPKCNPLAFSLAVRCLNDDLNRVLEKHSETVDTSAIDDATVNVILNAPNMGTMLNTPAVMSMCTQNICTKDKDGKVVSQNPALNTDGSKDATPKAIPVEFNFANQIVAEVEKCDYMLDIHAMSLDDNPCVILEYPNTAMDFAKALSLPVVITGWQEATLETKSPNKTSGYCANNLGKVGLGIECGSHGSYRALCYAIQSILDAMLYLGIISLETHEKNKTQVANRGKSQGTTPQSHIKIHKLHKKEKPGKMAKIFTNGEVVKKGEPIAIYDDGDKIIADQDYCMVMPPMKNDTEVGRNWFFVGVLQ